MALIPVLPIATWVADGPLEKEPSFPTSVLLGAILNRNIFKDCRKNVHFLMVLILSFTVALYVSIK